MKILITGANGFIGSYLMDFLFTRGYEIVGVVRDKKIKRNYKYIIGDLLSDVDIQEDFDVIIHCAAELDKGSKPMERYVEGNINTTQKVLKYARERHIKKIINLNGVRCFGKVEDGVISENTVGYIPESYGMTKAVAEKMLLDSELSVISLILPGVVGKSRHMMPWLMRVSKDLLEDKVIDCYDPDSLFNNIVHVNTLAQNIERLLTVKIKKNERVLLGSQNPIRKYDVLDFLRKGLSSNSEIRIIDSKEKSFYLDVSKARKMNFILPSVEEEMQKLIAELKE